MNQGLYNDYPIVIKTMKVTAEHHIRVRAGILTTLYCQPSARYLTIDHVTMLNLTETCFSNFFLP